MKSSKTVSINVDMPNLGSAIGCVKGSFRHGMLPTVFVLMWKTPDYLEKMLRFLARNVKFEPAISRFAAMCSLGEAIYFYMKIDAKKNFASAQPQWPDNESLANDAPQACSLKLLLGRPGAGRNG